jgi:hypothetical protein
LPEKEVKFFLDFMPGQVYNQPVMQKAPTNALTLIGARIRTAEAVQTLRVNYPASGACDQGSFDRDLPQLPDRM